MEKRIRTGKSPWDWFRRFMFWEPQKKERFFIGALLAVAFFAFCLRMEAELVGAPVIAVLAALCFLLLLVEGWQAARNRPLVLLLMMALVLMLGIGAHLSMFKIAPGRMKNVLRPMLDDMWNYDLRVAMAWEPGSWSGGYLIFMALISRLEVFSPLYAIKLFDLVSLSFASVALSRLAAARGAGVPGRFAAEACCLLLPTALMNAGLWAQCDAVFAALTLWGLVFLLKDRPWAGCAAWGAALAFKLQSAFLFPLVFVLFMRKRLRLRQLLVLFLAFLIFHLPMLLEGQGLASVFGRYHQQIRVTAYGEETEEEEGSDEDAAWFDEIQENGDELTEDEEPEPLPTHEGLADHAASVYSLMTVASVREFSGMGLYLSFAAALLVIFTLLRSKVPISNDILLTAAALLACGLPLILPQMNARMLFLAGLLSLARLNSPLRAIQAALLETVSICCYVEAVFSSDVLTATILPMSFVSLIAIAVACSIAWELYTALTDRNLKGVPHESA